MSWYGNGNGKQKQQQHQHVYHFKTICLFANPKTRTVFNFASFSECFFFSLPGETRNALKLLPVRTPGALEALGGFQTGFGFFVVIFFENYQRKRRRIIVARGFTWHFLCCNEKIWRQLRPAVNRLGGSRLL